jgi:hypothetical protein
MAPRRPLGVPGSVPKVLPVAFAHQHSCSEIISCRCPGHNRADGKEAERGLTPSRTTAQ